MRTAHSTKWKSSVQPRKQRKYVYNAPPHLAAKQLSVHLSTELRKKHGTRAIRVRVGDTVRILRGTHKGKEGKVELVDTRRFRLHIVKVETAKRQGGAAKYPVRPSSCLITALHKDDRRFKREKSEAKAPEKK